MATDESQQWCKLLDIPVDAPAVKVCAAFERLAVALAPRDLSMPVYCMLRDLSPAFAGCFCHLAYPAVKTELPEDRGWGVVLLASSGMLNRIPPHYVNEMLCLILTHELGHALCSLSSFQDWQEALADVAERPAIAAAAAMRFAPMTDPARTEAGPQLDSHGLNFTRAIAHLDYRLRRAGVVIDDVAAGKRYGQRDYPDCYAALGGEPASCSEKSFAEILARPLPPAFQECLL